MAPWFTLELEMTTSRAPSLTSTDCRKPLKLTIEGFCRPHSIQNLNGLKPEAKTRSRTRRKEMFKTVEEDLACSTKRSASKREVKRSIFELKIEKVEGQSMVFEKFTGASQCSDFSSQREEASLDRNSNIDDQVFDHLLSKYPQTSRQAHLNPVSDATKQVESALHSLPRLPAVPDSQVSSMAKFEKITSPSEMLDTKQNPSPSLRRLLAVLDSLQQRATARQERVQPCQETRPHHSKSEISSKTEEIEMHQNPFYHTRMVPIEMSKSAANRESPETESTTTKEKTIGSTSESYQQNERRSTGDMSIVYVPVDKDESRATTKTEKVMFSGPPPPVWRPIPRFPLPGRRASSGSTGQRPKNGTRQAGQSSLTAKTTTVSGAEAIAKANAENLPDRDTKTTRFSNDMDESTQFRRKLSDDERVKKEKLMQDWKRKPNRDAQLQIPALQTNAANVKSSVLTSYFGRATANKLRDHNEDSTSQDEADNELLDQDFGMRPTLEGIDVGDTRDNGRAVSGERRRYTVFRNGSLAKPNEVQRSDRKESIRALEDEVGRKENPKYLKPNGDRTKTGRVFDGNQSWGSDQF